MGHGGTEHRDTWREAEMRGHRRAGETKNQAGRLRKDHRQRPRHKEAQRKPSGRKHRVKEGKAERARPREEKKPASQQ